jgi:hypothetical protein
MENSEKPICPIFNSDGIPTFEDSSYVNPKQDLMGLSKREYFAGLAMQGWIACQSIDFRGEKEDGVRRAIEWADELLKQLEK